MFVCLFVCLFVCVLHINSSSVLVLPYLKCFNLYLQLGNDVMPEVDDCSVLSVLFGVVFVDMCV